MEKPLATPHNDAFGRTLARRANPLSPGVISWDITGGLATRSILGPQRRLPFVVAVVDFQLPCLGWLLFRAEDMSRDLYAEKYYPKSVSLLRP